MKVPSTKKLTKLVSKVSSKVIVRIKQLLYEARRIAISTDGWAAKAMVDNFLSVTCHFISAITKKKWNLKIGKEKPFKVIV